MTYLTIKWMHVISSTILFGTGIGSAFYLLAASIGRDARTVARVSRLVVLADWLFTTPTAIVQPLTGYLMMRLTGFPVSSPWLAWSIGLYVVAIACWLPSCGCRCASPPRRKPAPYPTPGCRGATGASCPHGSRSA